MPEIQTKHFNCIEFREEDVLHFPEGLPGLDAERRFVAVELPDTRPLAYLQSVTTPGVCFITVPVRVVDPNYRLALTAEHLCTLGLSEGCEARIGADVVCVVILTMAENGPPTLNLLAPLVVNLRTRRGVQAIQTDSGYSHEQKLPEPAMQAA